MEKRLQEQSLDKDKKTFEVYLYQYDITNGMATSIVKFMTGRDFPALWHTSLVVYGTEYYFGGGICKDPPRTTPYGTPLKESLFGLTQKTEEEFMAFLASIDDQFIFSTYHIINHNCNHFTDAISFYLAGKHIPDEILNQNTLLSDTAFGKWALACFERMNAKISQLVNEQPTKRSCLINKNL